MQEDPIMSEFQEVFKKFMKAEELLAPETQDEEGVEVRRRGTPPCCFDKHASHFALSECERFSVRPRKHRSKLKRKMRKKEMTLTVAKMVL
jgi:hypothetical protein